jgi:hypothetical protein
MRWTPRLRGQDDASRRCDACRCVLGASGPIRCLRDGDASSTTSRSSQLDADADWSYFALPDVSQNSLDWSRIFYFHRSTRPTESRHERELVDARSK